MDFRLRGEKKSKEGIRCKIKQAKNYHAEYSHEIISHLGAINTG